MIEVVVASLTGLVAGYVIARIIHGREYKSLSEGREAVAGMLEDIRSMVNELGKIKNVEQDLKEIREGIEDLEYYMKKCRESADEYVSILTSMNKEIQRLVDVIASRLRYTINVKATEEKEG